MIRKGCGCHPEARGRAPGGWRTNTQVESPREEDLVTRRGAQRVAATSYRQSSQSFNRERAPQIRQEKKRSSLTGKICDHVKETNGNMSTSERIKGMRFKTSRNHVSPYNTGNILQRQ